MHDNRVQIINNAIKTFVKHEIILTIRIDKSFNNKFNAHRANVK